MRDDGILYLRLFFPEYKGPAATAFVTAEDFVPEEEAEEDADEEETEEEEAAEEEPADPLLNLRTSIVISEIRLR